MKRLSEHEFSIKVISEATETESPKSQIYVDAKAINAFINGKLCEACIQYNSFYLVFTTDDCPFEESLNIYLLSNNFSLLDYAVLAWPYNTGIFELLELTEPNLIIFNFFGEQSWKIKIYDHKKIVMPYFYTPFGVWRKFTFKHHFSISREKPEAASLNKKT